MLIAGLAAPLGPLLGGVLLAYFGQLGTFAVFAAIAAAITIRMTLSKAIRDMRRPGEP